MTSFQPITAALRALDVLLAINRLRGASVGDVFRETGLNRPTVVRMLETLMFAGFITRHATQPLYMPTGRTLDLSSGYRRHEEMALVAAPVLSALHKHLQWPSDVAVFDGDAMVVARTSRGEGFLQFNRRPGYRAPLLGTSADPWNAITREPATLQRLLERVRREGLATMNQTMPSWPITAPRRPSASRCCLRERRAAA